VILLFVLLLNIHQYIFSADGGSSFPTADCGDKESVRVVSTEEKRRRTSSSSTGSYHSGATLASTILDGKASSSRSLDVGDEHDKVSVHSDESIDTESCMIPFSHVPLIVQKKMKAMCNRNGLEVKTDVLRDAQRVAWEIQADKFEKFVTEAMGVVFKHDVETEFRKIASANKHRCPDQSTYLAMVRRANKGTVPLSADACKSIASLARLSKKSQEYINMFCQELYIYSASKRMIEDHIRFRS